MHTSNLRKVGGSIMLSVPPALLQQLHLETGSAVNLSIENNQLMVRPQTKPSYTLAELLASSDYSQVETDDEWTSSSAVGSEIL